MTPESGGPPSAREQPERRYVLDTEPVETPTFSKPSAPLAILPGDVIAKTVEPRGFGLPDELYEARVTVVAALRSEGYPYKTIARALKMRDADVQWCVRKARERGLLRRGVAEAIQMLDEEGVPLAVDAVMRKLRKGEDKAVFGILEGRGILKNYSQVKTEGEANRGAMAFQFVFNGGPAGPSGPGALTIAPVPEGLAGQVVGVARGVEADEE